ncbi:MAG TPA: hypothetical protein VIC85_10445 [Ktedonobacterales bacterium]|jgi:hypothetical protein
MGGILSKLFVDACTAGGGPASGNTNCPNPEVFHYYLPWMIVCAVGLLIPIYYWLEGRRRFFKSNYLHKWLSGRMMSQLFWWAFVGPFLIFARWAMDGTMFQWRLWRYGWLLWGVVLVAYWVYYFVRHYESHRDWYFQQQTKAKYMPPQRTKRRASAKAG